MHNIETFEPIRKSPNGKYILDFPGIPGMIKKKKSSHPMITQTLKLLALQKRLTKLFCMDFQPNLLALFRIIPIVSMQNIVRKKTC